MSSPYDAAVKKAAEILAEYAGLYGHEPFPTIKGKLMSIVELRSTVDAIYVKRFKDTMQPIVGQVRRILDLTARTMAKSRTGSFTSVRRLTWTGSAS